MAGRHSVLLSNLTNLVAVEPLLYGNVVLISDIMGNCGGCLKTTNTVSKSVYMDGLLDQETPLTFNVFLSNFRGKMLPKVERNDVRRILP